MIVNAVMTLNSHLSKLIFLSYGWNFLFWEYYIVTGTFANSGGSITGGIQTAQKQPAVINLVLQNGSKLAEYLIDDINNMLGVKTGLAGRGMA